MSANSGNSCRPSHRDRDDRAHRRRGRAEPAQCPALTVRRVAAYGYRVKFDGVEIGSVSRRLQHVRQRELWHWGIDTMPLTDHGGRPPSGDADTFAEALQAFKAAFLQWHRALPQGLWERNREYIAGRSR
jgi:hypothetical protein